MKISDNRWLVGCILLVLGWCAVKWAEAHREPSYGGKSIRQWRDQAEARPGYTDYLADDAFRHMGKKAVPYLVNWLSNKDPWWVDYYWRHYSKLSPRSRRWLPAPRLPGIRQRTAAHLMSVIGPSAGAAVPELMAIYDREYAQAYHLPVGSKVDWSARLANPPASLPGGRSPYFAIPLQVWILPVIAQNGGDDRRIAPMILAAIHDPNMQFLANSPGNYKGLLKGNTNLVLAVTLGEKDVIAALSDSVPEVRAEAADMLGLIAPNHREVIAPLLKVAEDADVTVRQNAVDSLARSPVKLETVLPLLGRLWQNPQNGMRSVAMRLLISAGGGDPKFLTSLNEALSSADPAVRAAAAEGLAKSGPRSQIALPRLRELTNETIELDAGVRRAAAKALWTASP